jgi:hypothetical protein
MGPRLAVTADVHAGQPAFLLALVAVQLALSDRGAWLDQVNRQLSRPLHSPQVLHRAIIPSEVFV